MGIIIRQSAKSVFITYLGIGVGILNTLWLMPAILSKEQIGLYRTIITITALFATFASLGAYNIPNKFFPYFRDIKRSHNGFLFFILIVGMTGFLFFAALFLNLRYLFIAAYIKESPSLINYFYLILPFVLITLLISIFESYNTIQQKPVIPTFTRELLTRVFFTVNLIAFFILKFDYNCFINILIALYGLILIILIYYTYSQNYLFLKPSKGVFKSPHFKSIAAFSVFILMGNASGTVINNIDSLLLSSYKGLSATGVYSIAFFMATFIEIPKKSLSQVLIPLVSEANMIEDRNQLEMLYKKSSITQLVIGGLIFILLWFNIENIYKLIPHGQEYIQGMWVVFYLGLGKIFDMATGINQEIVGTSKFYKIDLAFYPFLGLVAIGANMFFIPIYGMTGAAIATAISVFLFNTIRFLFLLVVMKIQPFSLSTLKALLAFTIVFVINYFLPHIQHHFIVDIISRSIIVASVFISLILLLKVSEDINMIMNKIIKRFLPDNK
ncbi:MAG: oligosaccharide flippase family protein [Ignavibacteriaceae bacterium]|nr:oligosaccharide flippase family protein [Ignavibacteriaceae bacterium]